MGRGDYVPGYYRGDPGLFGAIAHVFGGAIGGFLTGGPLGAIRGAIGGTVSGTVANVRQATLAAGGSQSAYTPQLRARHAAVLARGRGVGQPMPGVGPGGVAGAIGPGGGGQRGFHEAKDGSGRMVRNRRMNVGNMTALRRASRRAHGFLRAVRGAVRYFTPKAHKGKAYVHFKKRRAA
jgi:hypothetical protein